MQSASEEARGDISGGLIRAAQYVRKSDEHQKYSTENQSLANQEYAVRRGMVIVRTYADEGKTGLTIHRRDALKLLLEVVKTGNADFQVILVYDVSRWGRFQDSDEAAYYEHLCKRAGISVQYCAEQFENDGSPLSTMLKGLKRAMAGEYSRELSVKVFAGQKRIAAQGYRLGGHAGYGLRRQLVDDQGNPRSILESGEWKSIATDRILLVPGPPHEIEIVRRIYSMFVHDRKHERQIAAILNSDGVPNEFGRTWHASTIGRILRAEKYAGNCVWNRSSFKLQIKRVSNVADEWVRADKAFNPVVDRVLFDAAQAIFQTRGRFSSAGRPQRLSDEAMLEALRVLLRRYGYLSRALIDRNPEVPSANAYYRRFGGLKGPYRLIGFRQLRRPGTTRSGRPRGLTDEQMLDTLRGLWRQHGYLTQEIIVASKNVPSRTAYYYRFGGITRAYELIGFKPNPRRFRGHRFRRTASNETLLNALRDLLEKEGRLTRTIIDECPSVPCHGTLENRFGSLRNVYRLIGYTPTRMCGPLMRPRNLTDEQMLDALRLLLHERGFLSANVLNSSKFVSSGYAYRKRFGSLTRAFELAGYNTVR